MLSGSSIITYYDLFFSPKLPHPSQSIISIDDIIFRVMKCPSPHLQIRCKNPKVCNEQGTKIIVTDLNLTNHTDFVLSARAFGAMARQGMDRDIFKLGILDVEYKR